MEAFLCPFVSSVLIVEMVVGVLSQLTTRRPVTSWSLGWAAVEFGDD